MIKLFHLNSAEAAHASTVDAHNCCLLRTDDVHCLQAWFTLSAAFKTPFWKFLRTPLSLVEDCHRVGNLAGSTAKWQNFCCKRGDTQG